MGFFRAQTPTHMLTKFEQGVNILELSCAKSVQRNLSLFGLSNWFKQSMWNQKLIVVKLCFLLLI